MVNPMRTQHPFLGLLGSVLLAAPAVAQEVPAPAPAPVPAPTPAPGAAPVSAGARLAEEMRSGEARSLTMAEAVRLALENAPDLKVAAAQAAGAQARYEQAKDSRYPTLSVSGNITQYTSDQTVCFAPDGVTCESDGGPVPDTVIRDATTYGWSASVALPLTAQITTFNHLVDAGRYEIEMTEVGRELAKREVAWQTEQAYLQLLKAQALQDTATASVELAQAQVDRVKRYVEAGVLAKNDLLRAELGLAQAQQVEIQAQTGVLLSEGALAVSVGLPAGTRITPTERYDSTVPPIPVTLEEAVKSALSRRPELDQVDAQIRMTGANKDVAKAAYYPQIALVGNAQETLGASLQAGVFVFAGLNASWTAWDWGVTRDKVAAAEAGLAQAQATREKLELGLITDVRSRYLSLLGVQAVIEVNAKSVESAQENLRITTTRFEAKAATTTDLLDAQVQLTRAQIQEVASRYDYYIALAGLKKAMGEPITDRYVAAATR